MNLLQYFMDNNPIFFYFINFILYNFSKIIYLLIVVLLSVALLTYKERKVISALQRRRGPNTIGLLGLLQPFADGLKLCTKETILKNVGNFPEAFIYAPILFLVLSFLGWAVIPLTDYVSSLANLQCGILFILAVSGCTIFSLIFAGYSSNSIYSFLGTLRAAAQIISYELAMGFVILTVAVTAGSLNPMIIVEKQEKVWYVIPFFPLFYMFYVIMLAENNRHPFDLVEAESELVSGYNIEYSSMFFASLFIAEYCTVLYTKSLIVLLFLGGWLPIFNFSIFIYIPGYVWFSLKVVFLVFFDILVRGVIPRLKYDQLMQLGWKVFLPFSISFFFFWTTLLWVGNQLPI